MKIDAFNHVLPPAYAQRLFAIDDSPVARNVQKRVAGVPALVDMDVRLRIMDEFGPDYRQIINTAAPPLEDLGPRDRTTELARIANEGMAEIVAAHPDRFAGFVAAVSLADVDAAIEEAQRAFDDLGAHGVQIYTHFQGGPMDQERFFPFYQAVAERGNKIIQVHPCRDSSWADYKTEDRSRFEIWWTLGWEYDLSAFMSRLVFAGVFERLPGIKILIHHGGAMIPHFAGRVGPGWDQLGARTPEDQQEDITGYPLTRRPLDYFKEFYVDTAYFGAGDPMRTAIRFFGVDHTLFASDSPFDPEKGPGYIRSTIANLEEMDILEDADREAIYHGNVARLLGLPD
ncbi:amidohydrolase [Citricoccus sp. SGAir0253]|uniref:amidohydrolase family protein n=1 Tax=Citricoccus sp. SGAir0253 TaxID=2567881 RepID=UPI0010CCFABF|nr:amidohydrolase family protein [Citricoccus sp. SGAir0253]QCU77569.1 amidohydrolase [Citricoccus sp. SGAir0253]